ncbi:MAG TPA: MFS transporter [Ignavibacteriales bacterium]|nr:MFS transporter [Ignavibacteriales bacterium]
MKLTKKILLLSFISLFTDMASEMLYPIMPLYLKSIGYSVVFIGILEGIAEFTSGISKGYFGNLSDVLNKKSKFIKIGYTISAIAKPLFPIFNNALWVLSLRTIDRFGKGIRTAPRDAMLSEESTIETKGRVFGFHRSMDTLGAVLGAGITFLLIYFLKIDYVFLFYLAAVPGFITILLLQLLKDKKQLPQQNLNKSKVNFLDFFKYWKIAPKNYKIFIMALTIFSIANSSDFFLLLRVKSSFNSDSATILLYIFYNIIYVIFSFPLGKLGDKIGLLKIQILGFIFFIIVYLSFSLVNSLLAFITIFFLYGIYAASTEGISKAIISNIVSKNQLGTALGLFLTLQSFSILIGNTISGFIWNFFSQQTMFIFSSILTFISLVIILFHSKILEDAY